MPATACPSRRFPGMPRAIPGPLRAKGTSPLETPDCRRRADHSASTRDRPAVSRPAGSRSSSVRWLPWVAITAPPLTCPVALRPVRPTFLGTCKICIPCNGISCPAEAGMCEPLRSRSRRTVQQPCQLLHGPQIWKSIPASSVIRALAGEFPGGPHGKVDPPCREPHDSPGRAVDGVAEPRAVDLPRLAEGL